MRKEINCILALLLVAVIFVLPACSTKQASNSSPDNSGSDVDEGTSNLADGGAGDRVTVTLWNRIFEDYNREYFEAMGEEFNETNDTIYLNQEFVPGDAWDEKMKSAQAAGTAPDIYLLNYGPIPYYAKDGLILPLDDLIPQDAWEDLYDNVKEMISYDGKYYAYPQLVEPAIVLYYRKDLFEQAGLDPNRPPRTWDEFIEYGKKLTTGDVFGSGFPGFGGDSWSMWGWMLNAAGHWPISDDWSKATVTDQGFVDLTNFIKTLYDEGIVPEQPLAGYNEIRPFGEGSLAMTFCGSWAIGQLKKDYPELVDVVGVAPAPTKDGNQEKTTTTVGGWTYVVDAKTEVAKEAGEYIYWLLGSDQKRCADFFKLADYSKYSPRKSVDDYIRNDPEGSEDEWMKVVSEQIIPYASPEPLYAWDIHIFAVNAIERVVLGGEFVEESLKKAEEEINTYIQENDYTNQKP